MEAAAGHELDDAGVGLAHQLYRETDGNPFFVAEILRNLSESGDIFQDATTGRWTAKDTEGIVTLPHSVRTVIGTRVSRLGEGATKVLSTASVIGRDFDLDLLGEITNVDEDELIDLLEEAQHAAVVDELPDSPGRYSFSHALVQHTLYEDLGATRRTRVHKAVGEAIERLYGMNNEDRLGELARHFLLATRPTDAHKAISYAQRAGEAALRALAPEDAVRYYSQALELAAHAVEREPTVLIELLIGLGTAERQAGTAEFRKHLLAAARDAQGLNDTDRLVAAALANTRGWSVSGQVDTEKIEILEAALESLGEGESLERARLLATLCAELNYGAPLERRLALADEAKAMARRLGDKLTLVEVVLNCSVALQAPQTLASALADSAEALSVLAGMDDPWYLFRANDIGWFLAVRSGQFDLARQRNAAVQELAARFPQPRFQWVATFHAACDALMEGDPAKGEELATTALEIGTSSGQPDAFLYYAGQLMKVRSQQGRLGEMAALIADALEQNPGIPTLKAVLAYAQLEAGDEDAARQLMDRGRADSFVLPEDPQWFDGMTNYGRVAIELDDRGYAESLFAKLAPFHDQVPNNGALVQDPVATILGGLATVLRRFDEAEAYFEEAAELNRRGEMRYSDAYTNMLWGRMLRVRDGDGDAERARQLLDKARESAVSCGYAMVDRRIVAEISKLA